MVAWGLSRGGGRFVCIGTDKASKGDILEITKDVVSRYYQGCEYSSVLGECVA